MKLSIIAHPNSKNPRIEKDLLGELHVHVNAPPLEGKANKEIVKMLAKYFKVKKNQVVIVSGQKTKSKIIEISKLR